MGLKNLIEELFKQDAETEWLEFKTNWFEAKRLGQYISALSNSASILDKSNAYMIWGINDFKEIVGTDFKFSK